MSVNKVILIGNLGRDPELRYTQGGGPVASLSVATTRKWRNKQSNEFVEETEWHKVSVFGKTAESCEKHLAKGRQVYIEGRLKTRSYDDKDGVKRYSTEIIAENVVFLGGGSRDGGSGERRRDDGPEPYDPGEYSGGKYDGDDDSIPF